MRCPRVKEPMCLQGRRSGWRIVMFHTHLQRSAEHFVSLFGCLRTIRWNSASGISWQLLARNWRSSRVLFLRNFHGPSYQILEVKLGIQKVILKVIKMHRRFFLHSSVSGHLGCFHVLAVVNSAAVNLYFPGGSDGKECRRPGFRRSPGEGNGYPLQYSGLENSMDREAWQATVHGVTKNWTWLSNFRFHCNEHWDTCVFFSYAFLRLYAQ